MTKLLPCQLDGYRVPALVGWPIGLGLMFGQGELFANRHPIMALLCLGFGVSLLVLLWRTEIESLSADEVRAVREAGAPQKFHRIKARTRADWIVNARKAANVLAFFVSVAIVLKLTKTEWLLYSFGSGDD